VETPFAAPKYAAAIEDTLTYNTSVSRNKSHAHSKANFDGINRATKT
jgi:hypothetical protein